MRYEEARWIGDHLKDVDSTVVEIGSSSLEFRTRKKPHIDAFIHAPLRERKVDVVHFDIKPAPGVDVVGDIFDPAMQARLAGANGLLCCNILEHVVDREAFAEACDRLLNPGGLAVISVPYSYPYHLDPIDTYYRPTPQEIARLFPRYQLVDSAIVADGSFGAELLRSPVSSLKGLVNWRRPFSADAWKGRLHRLLWLHRPYRVSIAVLRKPEAAADAA